MAIIGHQLVNADWNKFRPTKAVNAYHHSLTKMAEQDSGKNKNSSNQSKPSIQVHETLLKG